VRYRRGNKYFKKVFTDKEEAEEFASRVEDEGFDMGYEFLSLDQEEA
jgi:hypothetical protein